MDFFHRDLTDKEKTDFKSHVDKHGHKIDTVAKMQDDEKFLQGNHGHPKKESDATKQD